MLTTIEGHRQQPLALYSKACLRCAIGTRRAGEAIRRLTGGGVAVFVRHVPAEICDACGSEYFDSATLEQLQRLLTEAADAGIRFADVDYRVGSVFRGGVPRTSSPGL
jgi:YgiT-type zinc finger domain-containing protein